MLPGRHFLGTHGERSFDAQSLQGGVRKSGLRHVLRVHLPGRSDRLRARQSRRGNDCYFFGTFFMLEYRTPIKCLQKKKPFYFYHYTVKNCIDDFISTPTRSFQNSELSSNPLPGNTTRSLKEREPEIS